MIFHFYFESFDIDYKTWKINNPNFIFSIKNTFYKYYTKFIIFKLEESNYKVTENNKLFFKEGNFSISIEIEKLKKFYLKNKMNDKVIKLLEQFNKISENINFSIKDKNLLKFAFENEFIDINEVETRNLLLKFLENYYINISKSINCAEDIDFYIFLSLNIKNLSKKYSMNKNLQNNFSEKVNEFIFEKETREFIQNEDGKEFKKLFIIKFINSIKESNNKILENLEELNKENFKILMIKFIDNFKKLDKFFDTKYNKNTDFVETAYNDFLKIFYYEIVNENNELTFYWSITKIRKEIIGHFNPNILLTDEFKDEIEEKTVKNDWFFARSYSFFTSCFIRR